MKNHFYISLFFLLLFSIQNLSAQDDAAILGTWIGTDLGMEITYTIRKDSMLMNNLSQKKTSSLAIIKIIPETKEKEGRIIAGPDENKKYWPIWFRKRNNQVLAISSAFNSMLMMGASLDSPEKAEAFTITSKTKAEEGSVKTEKKEIPPILLNYWEKKYYDEELMKLPDFPLNDKQAFLKIHAKFTDLFIEKIQEMKEKESQGGTIDPNIMMNLMSSKYDFLIKDGYNPSPKSMGNLTQTENGLRMGKDADLMQVEEKLKKMMEMKKDE